MIVILFFSPSIGFRTIWPRSHACQLHHLHLHLGRLSLSICHYTIERSIHCNSLNWLCSALLPNITLPAMSPLSSRVILCDLYLTPYPSNATTKRPTADSPSPFAVELLSQQIKRSLTSPSASHITFYSAHNTSLSPALLLLANEWLLI